MDYAKAMNTYDSSISFVELSSSWSLPEPVALSDWPPLRNPVALGEQQARMAFRSLQAPQRAAAAGSPRQGTSSARPRPALVTRLEECRYCGDYSYEVGVTPFAGGVLVSGTCHRCGVSGQSQMPDPGTYSPPGAPTA